jgi:transglutaminase-like putative cysteine protease
MKKRRRASFHLITSVLFIVLAFCLQAKEQDSLWMTFITMVYSVTPEEDAPEINFLAYIPIITDDSIPVYLKLSDEAKYNSHVSGFTFKTIKGDGNLIRVTLKDLKKNTKYYLAFETYTLKKVDHCEDLPKFVSLSSYSGLSDEHKYYTQPSLSVQSSAPEIRAKAYEIFYRTWTGNVRKALENIVKFTGEAITYKAYGDQTALATLRRGYGVCTGKANLAVALARALGIPARILAVLSSHFISEFWIPNYGWVRGESTQGRFPEPKHIWTVDWIGSIEDENLFGSSDGIIAYLGIEGNGNATWYPEYDEINLPEHWIQKYATVDGDSVMHKLLFAKGADLWGLFCGVQNLGLDENQNFLFHIYQGNFFQSLVKNDIWNALNWADLAIAEGKRLVGLEESEGLSRFLKNRERIHEKTRLPFSRSHPY